MAAMAGKAAQTSREMPAKISFLRPVAAMAPATRSSSKALTDSADRSDGFSRLGPSTRREPGVLQQFFDRWVSPRRTATIADLQRGKNAGELRSEAEPELLNDAIFGAIYYRLLLRSGPLTRRFGEELVEQVIRGHRSRNARSR